MMRPARVLGAIGVVVRLEAFLLLIPIPFCLDFSPADRFVGPIAVPSSALVFLASSLLCALFCTPVLLATGRARSEEMLEREGVLTVALGWLVASLFGMLPFLMLGTFSGPQSVVNAFFEAMSGFTGTGVSAILPSQVGSLDKGLLIWRALMPFVGGIGIIVLFVALLSKLHQSSLPVVPAEAGGHMTRRLQPKLAETARTLWILYVSIAGAIAAAMTAVLWLKRWPFRLALFESLAHVLSAYGTGGFGTANTARLLHDPVVSVLLMVAMLVGATNFTLLFLLVRRRDLRMLFDPEWRFWLVILAGAALLNTLLLWRAATPFGQAFRQSTFTVVAFGTGTAAFHVTDYSTWPPASLLILMLLMFMGGMAGSAAGGVKLARWLVLWKTLGRELRKILHPRAVLSVRVGDRLLKEEALTAVAAFFFTYLAAWVVATLVLVATDPILAGGNGLMVGAFAAAATLGNAGGGIGLLGPNFGYGALLWTSKLILTALMWAGRLELFAALLLFNPRSWRS
ncbi:MAG: TrkH family potassium uptake protein [Thermoplasmatota archaeon]